MSQPHFCYLPRQNWLKSWVISSSGSSIPSDFSENFQVRVRSTWSKSTGIPRAKPSLTAWRLSTAFSMREMWRALERYVASCSTSPAFSKKRALIRSSIWSMFWFSERKSWYDLPAVGRFRSSLGGRPYWGEWCGCYLEISRSWRSWSVKGSLALRTRRTRSASLRAFSTVRHRSAQRCLLSHGSRPYRLVWGGNAVDVDVFLDNVPSGSFDIGNNGFFFAQEVVEEAGLADVWTTDNSSRDPFTQDLTATGSLEEVGQEGFKFTGFSRMISVVASSTSSYQDSRYWLRPGPGY